MTAVTFDPYTMLAECGEAIVEAYPVEPRPGPRRRHHPERDRDQQPRDDRPHGDVDRGGQAVEDQLAHRGVELEGHLQRLNQGIH